MKITLDNFAEVRTQIIQAGIDHVEYDSKGAAQSLTTKDGQVFEFDPSTFDEFKRSGLLVLGKRAHTK